MDICLTYYDYIVDIEIDTYTHIALYTYDDVCMMYMMRSSRVVLVRQGPQGPGGVAGGQREGLRGGGGHGMDPRGVQPREGTVPGGHVGGLQEGAHEDFSRDELISIDFY